MWQNPSETFTSGVELANYLNNNNIGAGQAMVALNADGTFSIWIYK